MNKDKERRRHCRHDRIMPALIELPDGHRIEASTRNLSKCGAQLMVERRLPCGVYFMLELTPCNDNPHEVFTLWASVLYSSGEKTQAGYGLGVQYAHPPDHYVDFVHQIARRNRPSPVPVPVPPRSSNE